MQPASVVLTATLTARPVDSSDRLRTTVDAHLAGCLVHGLQRMMVDGRIRTLDQVTEVRILDPQLSFHHLGSRVSHQRPQQVGVDFCRSGDLGMPQYLHDHTQRHALR